MQIKNEQEYISWKAKQTNAYSMRVFTYAEDWADLMEKHIEEGRTIEECADTDSHTADTDGITGFMYGAAVAVLAKCWIHGEELRKWHNLETQLGTEGEKANKTGAILNPAIMHIK